MAGDKVVIHEKPLGLDLPRTAFGRCKRSREHDMKLGWLRCIKVDEVNQDWNSPTSV